MEDGLKISELTQASTINDSDLIPIVQNDETKNITKQNLVADIKALIDSNSTYSTTEQIVGTWIDNKPIYRKVIECGALPNNTNKDVSHNIQNLGVTIKCNGMAVRTSDSRALTIPDSTPSAEIVCGVTNTNVYITTQNDRSSFNNSFLILEYTKTTD